MFNYIDIWVILKNVYFLSLALKYENVPKLDRKKFQYVKDVYLDNVFFNLRR